MIIKRDVTIFSGEGLNWSVPVLLLDLLFVIWSWLWQCLELSFHLGWGFLQGWVCLVQIGRGLCVYVSPFLLLGRGVRLLISRLTVMIFGFSRFFGTISMFAAMTILIESSLLFHLCFKVCVYWLSIPGLFCWLLDFKFYRVLPYIV